MTLTIPVPVLPTTIAFPTPAVLAAGVAAGVAGLLVIYFGLLLIRAHRERIRVNLSLNYALLVVELPKYHALPKENTPVKVPDEITTFENFLTTLAKVPQPIIFEVATSHSGEEIFFYLAVPRKYIEAFQKGIRGTWPGSEVSVVTEDYNIFNPEGVTLASYVTLKSHSFKPVKTYRDIALGNVDTLDAFLAAFNRLRKEGEGLAYQVIVKPLPTKFNQRAAAAVRKLREGKKFHEATGGSIQHELAKAVRAPISAEGLAKQKEAELKPKIIDEVLVKQLEAKLAKPFFEVNIRLIASGQDPLEAEQILSTLETAFHQYANPGVQEFIVHRVAGRTLRDLAYRYSFRIFDRKRAAILNTEELASVLHFPTSYTKSPVIHFLSARNAAPPPNLPAQGVILGENLYQGARSLVRITREDRRRHCYVIGQTGTGKTTMLKNVIEQDITAGEGVCYIDPHGDVAQELLGLIPKERADDVIYFNPGDPRRPFALNILEYDPNLPEQKTFIINALIEIIDKLYNLSQTGGPMFEQYLRNSLLLIMDDSSWGHTLLDVSRVFVDESFRKDLLGKCKNYAVVEFWTKQAPLVGGELSMENMITWVTSKLNPFITNDFVRPIIAQPKSSFDFRAVMDQRKILIVNLAKGKIGETSAYLLGMVLVAKLLAAAFARVDTPEAQRQDFYLFIDEFQNFAFKGIASILSEARKYRLALTLAHQYIKQLPEDISAAVFGNVGTIVSFRVGIDDAEYLEKQFVPIFSKVDLVNIPNYQAYLKLLISGYISDPFSLRTLRPTEPNLMLAQKLADLSGLKYGRPREEVEAEVARKFGYVNKL